MDDNTKPWRWSWRYEILKRIVKISFRIYYRKLCVTGLENIPRDGRIIFAANHQNALLDALAILFTNNYQAVFLARADLFRNPFLALILRFLKIMPVYRLRDGIGSMGENQDTFDNAASLLASGGCIGIMPEGNHHRYKRLRPLKKGFGRIAFRAAEIDGADAGIKIVPVGLNYSDTPGFRTALTVKYGKPIEVSDYLDLYRSHPQAGINALKEELAGSLASLILNVKDEKNYQTDRLLVDYGGRELARRLNVFAGNTCDESIIERKVCNALYEYFETDPEKADSLRAKSTRVLKLLNSSGYSPESGTEPRKTSILRARFARIAMLPVILTGLAVHLIPVTVIHLALKGVKEPEFLDSYKFVLGTLLVPLNYILITVLALSYIPPIYAVPLVVVMPLSGLSAFVCYIFYQKLGSWIKFSRKCGHDKTSGNRVPMLKNNIVMELEPVLQIAGRSLSI